MDKNEAIIRYAMQHGKLDDLKVWLLNGGSVNEYFTSHKQNIKLVIKEKSFSVTAKEAADIVEGMMPIEFSRQDFVNLYFKLSEEKQEELYDEVFSYYPQVIRTKKNPSSKEILDAVKRAHYIYFPDNFYDILSDDDLAECLLYDESMMHNVPENRWNSELAILFSKKLADKGAYYDRIYIPEEYQSAIYWENLCKADGYYYRILPEKYKDILSEELILFTLKNTPAYKKEGAHQKQTQSLARNNISQMDKEDVKKMLDSDYFNLGITPKLNQEMDNVLDDIASRQEEIINSGHNIEFDYDEFSEMIEMLMSLEPGDVESDSKIADAISLCQQVAEKFSEL